MIINAIPPKTVLPRVGERVSCIPMTKFIDRCLQLYLQTAAAFHKRKLQKREFKFSFLWNVYVKGTYESIFALDDFILQTARNDYYRCAKSFELREPTA